MVSLKWKIIGGILAVLVVAGLLVYWVLPERFLTSLPDPVVRNRLKVPRCVFIFLPVRAMRCPFRCVHSCGGVRVLYPVDFGARRLWLLWVSIATAGWVMRRSAVMA